MPGFVLLVRDRADGDPVIRVGYTVTKKIGGAVVRNRMKRRLRALARELLPERGVPGADHVLIGRAGGVERDFALLRGELVKALSKITNSARPELVEGPSSSSGHEGKAGLRQAQPERLRGDGC
jgi:ribonuclease P protein component